MMTTATKTMPPKERIIEAALDLFYKQGYLSTGINQIIKEAGVSKASFYDHFKSKDELCVAYLQERHAQWGGEFKDKINEFNKPLERFMAPLAFLEKWLNECDFRGCAFLNIASEISDSDSIIRKEVIYTMDGMRSVIKELTKDLKSSDQKYSHIDVEFVAAGYFMIIEGTIKASQIYGEAWPVKEAKKLLEKIIKR